MTRERDILEKTVFIGGVPRSGTTFLARSMNSHPNFVLSADDHVLECWALYYYRTRVGIVDDLRRGSVGRGKLMDRLQSRLFENGRLLRALPSDKIPSLQRSAPPLRPDGISSGDQGKIEHVDIPVSYFLPAWRLCLKSPEITYVLDDLAGLLPGARFILAYRPVAEVAESMYRMGEKVKKINIFHRRWQHERDDHGRLIPPPGVPDEWAEIWHEATDFQRCVINGASYLRALVDKVERIPSGRVFIYNHNTLKEKPARVFSALSAFLGVDDAGFAAAAGEVVRKSPGVPATLAEGFQSIEETLASGTLEKKLAAIETAPVS